jgi:hypothetical protein
MLRDARTGEAYVIGTRTSRGRHTRVLLPAASLEGTGACVSFPMATFERAILTCLKEIDPRSILDGDDAPDEAFTLAEQLAGVEARISELETELMNGDVAALARVLRQLEDRKKDITSRLAEARCKAATPLSELWARPGVFLRPRAPPAVPEPEPQAGELLEALPGGRRGAASRLGRLPRCLPLGPLAVPQLQAARWCACGG